MSITVVRGDGSRGVHAVPSSAVVESRGCSRFGVDRRRRQRQTTACQTADFVFGGFCGDVQRVRVVRAVRPTAGGLFRVCGTTAVATASVRRRWDDDGTGPVTVPVFPFLFVGAATTVARDDGGR